ncbi:MAG: ABC transporter ATP-binding protein [Pseudomonadota bacterium]
MLAVAGLTTAYGASQVLFGVDFRVGEGEVVTLMGRNGMGKSTTVKSIMGLAAPSGGSIRFEERELIGKPAYAVARLGLGLVPEGRQVFPNLTVRENLVATAANRSRRSAAWTVDRVYELFPGLQARTANMGGGLSGGEQQMLAVGRALMTNPKLLILDEATEGLAPLVRQEIWQCIENLKANGQSILLIDKSVDALTRIGDRHYILERGRVVWEGDSVALRADLETQQSRLGV